MTGVAISSLRVRGHTASFGLVSNSHSFLPVWHTGKKLWEFDTNPKDAVWPRTRNELISTPVIADNVVYIASGQDPEHRRGRWSNWYAIDGTKPATSHHDRRIWQLRPRSSSADHRHRRGPDGLVYIADFSGFLHCIDAKTGEEHWSHDVFAAVWGSPFLVDGHVYLGDEDGDIVVLAHGREKKVLAEMNMGSAVYATVVPANGHDLPEQPQPAVRPRAEVEPGACRATFPPHRLRRVGMTMRR